MSEDPTPTPPDDRQTPPEGTETPPPPTCAECGTPLEAEQAYCLECGAPTPRAPRLTRGGRAGVVLGLALIVLGVGAGALAYAVINDDEGPGGATTAPVTSPTTVTIDPGGGITIPTGPGIGTLPTDTSGLPTSPYDPGGGMPTDEGFPTDTGSTGPFTDLLPGDPSDPVDPGDPGDPVDPVDPVDPIDPVDPVDPVDPGGASDWPAGTSAWTAVISSVRDESEARDTADRLAAGGEEAGVLFSSDHPGLRPGYWVVFSGSHPSQAAAAALARRLSGDFPGAYPRYIEG